MLDLSDIADQDYDQFTCGLTNVDDVWITNSIFDNLGSFLATNLGDVKNLHIEGNRFYSRVPVGAGAPAFMYLDADSGGVNNVSSGTTISRNKFYFYNKTTAASIIFFGNTQPNYGAIVEDNYAVGVDSTTFTFVKINGAKNNKIIIKGNVVNDMLTFISDAGGNTAYVNNDNFFNGLEQ